jgi:hypothetical protein
VVPWSSLSCCIRKGASVGGLFHCPSKFQITASAAISSMHMIDAAADAVHLNCGTVGTLMCGGGNGATLLAFPIPLGSVTVLIAVPIAAPRAALVRPNPPPRANEAVVEAAKTMKITEASFTAVFDIGSSIKTPALIEM